MDRDRVHLQLLVLGHWIIAVFAVLFALFPVIGLLDIVVVEPENFHGTNDPPKWSLFLFVAAWFLLGLAYAACMAIAARRLSQRRHRTFCLVMAGITCALFPLGTVLGMFTLPVLFRDSVRSTFEGGG